MEQVQLQDLGYGFNSEGKLRQLNADGAPGAEPYVWAISRDASTCHTHYEAVADAVTRHIYTLLETQEKLSRLPVPVDAAPGQGTFVFASRDYAEKDVLLILIHGAGGVRAGQWARRLIIKHGLDKGSQIPYIKKAISKGYGVLVMNTNENSTEEGDEILGSEGPQEHAAYVWRNYVAKAKSSSILIVAHSYGGTVAVSLDNQLQEQFERVKAIAFTDSVHDLSYRRVSEFVVQVSRNWVRSSDPLDTPLRTPEDDVERVSAGHYQHEMTSYSCMDSVFKFFDEKLNQSADKEVPSNPKNQDEDSSI